MLQPRSSACRVLRNGGASFSSSQQLRGRSGGRNPPIKLCEKATSQLICLTRSGVVALGQEGIGPLFFHIVYVKHNVERLWNFIPPPPPRPRLSPPGPKPPCSQRK